MRARSSLVRVRRPSLEIIGYVWASLKRRSPFPHTVVAQLTNDIVLFQPTREAFEQQGYEALVGPNRVSLAGIEKIVDTAVDLLDALWQRGSCS